jgi:sugar phosphate permease
MSAAAWQARGADARVQSLPGAKGRRLQPPPSQGSQQPTAAAARALRKRWWFLLPAVFVTYSLAYLDRANYGFGAAAGLAETLHITERQSSLLGSLFFLGYFVFQVPGVALVQRASARLLISLALLVWGVLAAATGLLHTFAALAAVRLGLGVAESFIFPAMLLLLTRWFTRAERSRANSLLMLGNPGTVLWMSALTGFLMQALGWQRTFVLEGLPAVVWAGAWFLLVRDEPHGAAWMTPEATKWLQDRLAQEQMAVPAVSALRAAFRRADVLLLSAVYFFWSLGIYGFVLWLPKMVRVAASLSMGRTGLLAAVPYAAAIPLMLGVAYSSDRMLRRRHWVWPFLLLAGLALAFSFLAVAHSLPAAFAGLVVAGACMYAPYGPFFAIIPERVPRNVVGEVMALINSFGALGAFVGTYMVGWFQAATGSPKAGFLAMALAMVLSAALMALLGRVTPSMQTLPDLPLPPYPAVRTSEA